MGNIKCQCGGDMIETGYAIHGTPPKNHYKCNKCGLDDYYTESQVRLYTIYMEVTGDIITARPPLGLTPKHIHDRLVNKSRMDNIKDAIFRYIEANKELPNEWIEEWNTLIKIANE